MSVDGVHLGAPPRTSKSPISLVVTAARTIGHALRRVASDRLRVSISLAILLIAAGFAAFLFAYNGTSLTLVVGVQLAYLVSGGLAGMALIVSGIGFVSIQYRRRLAVREDQLLDAVIDRTVEAITELRKWKETQSTAPGR